MTETTPAGEAGRDLDALVAETVMGWTAVRFMGPPDDLYGRAPGRNDSNYAVPHYSTNIAAAWQVLTSMRGWSFSERLKFGNELNRLVCERKEHRGIVIHLTDLMIYMEPEDICKAALKAMEAHRV